LVSLQITRLKISDDTLNAVNKLENQADKTTAEKSQLSLMRIRASCAYGVSVDKYKAIRNAICLGKDLLPLV